ncbi:MAG: calcium/sodium antiporter [Patescibacteria group bacterium]
MTLIALIVVIVATLVVMSRVVDGYFVPALEAIAEKWKLSYEAAGATLMAMGSSAPELFVALIAILKPGDHEAIGVGAIVGSALFNILVIIGISAMVQRAVVSWQPVIRDSFFYIAAVGILLFTFQDGVITLVEAVGYVLVYIVYVIAVLHWQRLFGYEDKVTEVESSKEEGNHFVDRVYKQIDAVADRVFLSKTYHYTNFFIAIVFIALLSWMLVEAAIEIAHILDIPEVIIALTVIAIGTSISDLLSSVAAARRGRGGMAISNAIGSNIFDILIGLGLPWLILLAFSGGDILQIDRTNLLSSIFLLFATVLVILFLLLMRRWEIGRRTGVFLVALYVAYLVWVVMQTI